MLVNDDRSELTQGTWYARLARERLNLSVSVEETLVHPRREQLTRQEECNEQTNVLRTTHGRMLFPPRLSLQSRPFPVVESTGLPQASCTGMSDGLASTASDLTVLMRFAQRLTSSFAAMEVTEACAVPEPVRADVPFLASDPSTFQATDATTTPFLLERLGITRPLPPVPSYARRPQSVHGKHRLAGCAVRVRLETAPPQGATPPLKQPCALSHTPEIEHVLHAAHSGLGATSARMAIVNDTRNETSHTSAHLPIPDFPRIDMPCVVSTSAHLPVPECLESIRKQAKRRTFSGSGLFESGQSDVIMANPAVTAASVVLVTLTENPGPVVLQYVSLQPGVGFTLHLTAPAARKIAFNYVILVGELFQDVEFL